MSEILNRPAEPLAGPWSIQQMGSYANILSSDRIVEDVATVYNTTGSPWSPAKAACAHLIAAAPDLLAALQDIIKRNEIQHWFNLDQARAAIAKANGVQP